MESCFFMSAFFLSTTYIITLIAGRYTRSLISLFDIHPVADALPYEIKKPRLLEWAYQRYFTDVYDSPPQQKRPA
jgi:hypothetical protein